MRLRQGDERNLDELLQHWVAMGYRVAPTVEEPGELNRRGGIVDIFPPGDEQPLRVEFFGDEVDSRGASTQSPSAARAKCARR